MIDYKYLEHVLFCRKCGTRLLDNKFVCSNCGTKTAIVILGETIEVSPDSVTYEEEKTIIPWADHVKEIKGDSVSYITTKRKVYIEKANKEHYFIDCDHNCEVTIGSTIMIDVDNAVQCGVLKSYNSDELLQCVQIGEIDNKSIYKYACTKEGKGGYILLVDKESKYAYYYGYSKKFVSIFHNNIVSVDDQGSINGAFNLFSLNLRTRVTKKYAWFGRYSQNYDEKKPAYYFNQDTVMRMHVDYELDAIILNIHRKYLDPKEATKPRLYTHGYVYPEKPSPFDDEEKCNVEIDYQLIVKYYDNAFHAYAEYPALGTIQIFEEESGEQ